MRKIIVILAICMMLAGCGSYSSRDENTDENYRTGTQGLAINFMNNMPPTKIYDDEPFQVVLEVRNRGATDIESGSNSKVYISGFDSNIIVGIPSSGTAIEDLDGKSIYNRHGEYTTVDFEGTISDLESKNIDNYNFRLLATACFNYKTIAEPAVCIDPDPYSSSDKEKACNGNTNPSVGSQGAPIQITSIDVESLKGRTKFKIHVSNAGGGTVFRHGYSYLDHCNPYDSTGLEYTDVDYVTLTKVMVSNTDIKGTCKPVKDSQIRLIDGRAEIVCEYSGLSGPAYTTPLIIELDYGYRISTSRNIEIIATPE